MPDFLKGIISTRYLASMQSEMESTKLKEDESELPSLQIQTEERHMRLMTWGTMLMVFLSITMINSGFRPAHAHGGKNVSNPMSDSLTGLNGPEFEVRFLDQMIQHHRSGVDMANLVLTHSERPELKSLAENIISAQSKEIEEMSQWLEGYQAKPHQVPNKRAHQKMKIQMEKLAKAKHKDFDKMFLDMMIKHHAGAVRMSSLVKQKRSRPELQRFAEKVILDQTAEIKQMKGWRQAWKK